jgi:hypothetical protein
MALQNPEQAALLKPKRRRNKMNATGCRINGIWFDSLGEAGRYLELLDMQKEGLISRLKIHERYRFRCGKSYEADFVYLQRSQCRQVVEDVKGYMTPLATMKIAMMLNEYGIEVKLVNPTRGHRELARAAQAQAGNGGKE